MNLRIGIFSILTVCLVSARGDLVHGWSFNQPAGAAANGTTIVDQVSGASAVVRGVGGVFSGTAITLPGTTTGNQTPAAISAYVDLPNGVISSKTNLTVEIWATPLSYQAFQRLFDFGRVVQAGDGMGAAGEITGLAAMAPGATQASDGLTLTLSRNTANNIGQQRFEGKLNGVGNVADPAGLFRQVDTNIATSAGTEYHYVLTFEDGVGEFGATGGRMSWYRDGVLAATMDLGFRLNQLEDVNNWLGRSLWSGDRQVNAAYNEARVYNHAFTPSELAASRAAGPNPSAPVAQSDSVTMHRGQKVLIPILANDAAAVRAAIVQPPQHGTAVIDQFGRVLYTHQSGAPASDTFSYAAINASGQSTPALVTISFSDSLRIASSSINVPATPPPLAIQLTTAASGLAAPLCIASPPGETERLFVCQKGGLVRVCADFTAATPIFTTFLDLPALLTSRGEAISTASEQGLLGLAFHPNYASNRHFFLCYSVTLGGAVYQRVSRFTTQAANPQLADPATERILIQQLDEAGNHNGGDLHFGPDGYLYISLGDEGNQNDSFNNSQTITKDFFSAVARIDVDKLPGNLAPNPHAAVPTDGGVARYSVPADNPFVGATTFNGAAIAAGSVRSEFWAVGLRNPWRFSFDGSDLWLADVGQDVYEEVDLIAKGKNYGWAFREGAHAGPKAAQAPADFDTANHAPPLYEYVHNNQPGDSNFKGNSVTGGVVYRGTRFPTLAGRYIFADYVSGNVWSLTRNGANPPTVARIAGEVGIVAFGTDPSNGDVLLADIDGNRLLRLVVGAPAGTYPATLSETGLFSDLTDLAPAPGLLPYAPNLPFWSDHAIKSRWFAIPNGTSKMTWSKDGSWSFPAGQIWVKHFDLEMTRGNPASKKRLETRLLVRNGSGAYGVSYRWNEEGTDATLVPDGGEDFALNVTINGAPSTQQWHIPSRSECLACHTPQAGHALSFTTRQMNRMETIHGFTGNQLTLLENAGYFTNSPGSSNVLPRHVRPDEAEYPLEVRVRSYVAVNCSYCHMAGGTASPAAWDGRPELTLDATGLINGTATNNGGDAANKLVVPGSLQRSVVYNRAAATNGFTRMPPLATSELDHANLGLLSEWITSSLPSRQSYAGWRLVQFGSAVSAEGDPAADPDGDGYSNRAEFLALGDPLHGGTFLTPSVTLTDGNASVSFEHPGNRSAVVLTSSDLVSWSLWDAPNNAGLPRPPGLITITGPAAGAKQFFRVRLEEN